MSHHKLDYEHSHETRIALLEQSINNINNTLVRFEKRFDRIDEKLESMQKESTADFRWLVKFIISTSVGLGALMAHGFHWY